MDWGALATLLGGMATSRGTAKVQQNNTALEQFQQELAARIAQTNASKNRAATITSAPGARLAQSATGNMVQNWQPVNVAPYVAGQQGNRISGGFNSLGFDPTTKQIAGNNQADALKRSEMGWGAPDISPEMTMPNAPTMSSGSALDSLLGYGGAAAGLLKAFLPNGTGGVAGAGLGSTGGTGLGSLSGSAGLGGELPSIGTIEGANLVPAGAGASNVTAGASAPESSGILDILKRVGNGSSGAAGAYGGARTLDPQLQSYLEQMQNGSGFWQGGGGLFGGDAIDPATAVTLFGGKKRPNSF